MEKAYVSLYFISSKSHQSTTRLDILLTSVVQIDGTPCITKTDADTSEAPI